MSEQSLCLEDLEWRAAFGENRQQAELPNGVHIFRNEVGAGDYSFYSTHPATDLPITLYNNLDAAAAQAIVYHLMGAGK